MKLFLTISMTLLSLAIIAQQPLSKKDQKRKEEFDKQIADEATYAKLMEEADVAFKAKDYVTARMTFNEAIQYNPENEAWLISKVNDLDILMAQIIAREVDSVMVMQPKQLRSIETSAGEAVVLEERSEKMEISLPEEKEAVLDEAEEDPIEEEVKEIKEEVVSAKSAPEKVTAEIKKIAPPIQQEKEEVKVIVDYSKYPQGRSDETFTFPDHTVRRVIVKDGIDTIVYKYVTHRWGGKFYFKDGVSIVDRIWKQEVEEYESKYPINQAAE